MRKRTNNPSDRSRRDTRPVAPGSAGGVAKIANAVPKFFTSFRFINPRDPRVEPGANDGRGWSGRRPCNGTFNKLILLLLVPWCLFLASAGCRKKVTTARLGPPTLASLVPAATDLMLGMGLGDRLVGVSTYDRGRPDVGDRPAVGDYQTVDWERLAELRPTAMVVQIALDRLPAGFQQHADDLHIQLINVQIDRLADIPRAMKLLGHAVNAASAADASVKTFNARLDALRRRTEGVAPEPTLIALNETGTAAVGPGTFISELLSIAGGSNVVDTLHQPWPTIDDETLHALKPDVVIVLMPGASPQAVAEARANWARRTDLPAVRAGRVQVVTALYALLPGWHVADLAETMSQCLQRRPSPIPKPAAWPSPAGAPAG